jgi:hypothetical protein
MVGVFSTLPVWAAPVGGSGSGGSPPAGGQGEHHGSNGETDVSVCSGLVAAGMAHCDARIRTDAAARGGSSVPRSGVSPAIVPDGRAFGPADLQAAYHAPSATQGSGQTVAIVDAFDDPNAESDLAVYRSTFGIPACTTANGCFRKVNQSGGTSYPSADHGWGEEISLDIDMVSALCPLCHILLVEASSTSFTDLGAAVNEAVALGARVVSNSYGASEFSFEALLDSSYYDHPGIAITASSGDSGYGVDYPAASPKVIAVGGTRLVSTNGTFSETVWSGGGSGCSAYEAKPAWQTDNGCTRRTVADVSAVADPGTGVWVNDTYGGDPGFEIFGGTSVSSPIVASFYALASNPASQAAPASYPYAHPSALNDVLTGNNGSCGGSYLCTAGVGYDGPTGLGTPNTDAAFAAANDFGISAAPSALSVTQGSSGSSTINTTLTSGSAQSIALSLSGAPSGVTASFNPTSVTAGGASTLTLTVASSTVAGTYPLTITGTAAVTHATTVTLTVTAAAGSGIINGGFETGNLAPWTVTGTATVGGAAHTGSYAAVVGSISSTNGDSSIAQTFSAPTAGATLTFWYNVHCPDTVTYDWATAKLRDNTAGSTSTLLGRTCTNNGTWHQVNGTLVAGHNYTLTLTSHDDNYPGDPTYTQYDDVTLGPPPGPGIINGGFETGNLTGWTPNGTANVTSSSHSGTYAAQLGSTSPSTDSSITQTYTTPGSATTLTFWFLNFCPDTLTYDWATVILRDNTTATTTTPLPRTCSTLPTWSKVTVKVIGGHNYTLTLANHDDNYPGDPTFTLYDDIAVQ